MSEIGSAFLSILPSTKGFNSKLESEVGGGLSGSGKKLGGVFGKAFAAGGALIAAAGIGSFLKGSLDEAREAQKVSALTANVIKTTGGAAKISAKAVGDLTTSISNKTAVDDEAIQSGANLLLTFKNVKREGSGLDDVFGRATAAAVDLSASGFGDINGASKQLGKALNDPIKGISALGKSGVTFSAQQQEQIKGFVKSNDLLSAQKIILKEVESQVKGAAEAQATTADKAKVAYGNLKEAFGTKVTAPAVDALSGLFLSLAPTLFKAVNAIGPAFDVVKQAISDVVRAVGFLFNPQDTDAARGFGEVIDNVFGNTGKLIAPLRSIGEAVRGFIGQVQIAIPQVQAFAGQFIAGLLPVLGRIGTVLLTNVVPVLQALVNTFLTIVLPAVTSFVSYVVSALLPVFTQVVAIVAGRIIPILSSLAVFFYSTLYPAIFKIVTAVAQNLKPVFDQLVATFQSQVLPAANKLLAAFQRAQPTLQKVAVFVLKVVGAVLKFAAAVLGKVLPVAIRLVGFFISKMVPVLISVVGAIAKAIGAVINFGKTVVNGVKSFIQFSKGVKDKIGDVVGYVKALPGKIKGFFTKLPGELKTIGTNIIDGLKNGIKAAGQRVLDAVNNIVDKIPKFIRKKLGIASPSKVTTKLGANISDGLRVGISSGAAGVATAARTTTEAAGKAIETAAQKQAKKAKEAAKKLVDGVRDGLRDKLSGLRDDFASLSGSVASAFTGNLFEATNAGDFIKNLLGTQGQLQSLKAAFNKLLGYGLKPAFLSQLFASGNGGLILDLAAQDQASAVQAGSLFGDVTDLSTQLGDKVAQADVGPKIDATNALLTKLVSLQGGAAVAFAKEINGAAAGGKKKGNKGGKKKR